METFSELESKYRQIPVRTRDGDFAGVFTLDREKTVLRLAGSTIPHRKKDQSGWFDIHLIASNGMHILLHHALQTQSTFFGGQRDRFEEHIFPNTVVYQSDRLGKAGNIKTISFQLDKMGWFFHHQYVEYHSLYKASKNDLKNLRRLRAKQKHKYDFFRPSNVYIVHKPTRAIRFQVNDRTYEVFTTASGSLGGWDRIDFRSAPVGCITFSNPTPIDVALEHIWSWAQFFSQIAMQPLAPLGISARSQKTYRHGEASLYLPNLKDLTTDSHFHPGDVPLSSWHDREGLTTVMQQWLSLSKSRQRFRVSLNSVIERMRRRASLDDIVTLCAGIESLVELNQASGLTNAQIEILTQSSKEKAEKEKIDVNTDRIRNLFKMLQQQSLSKKLTSLFSKMNFDLSPSAQKDLVKTILELRTIAAHGSPYSESTIPRAAPAIQALASACSLFDLTTCGVPIRANEHAPIPAANDLESALRELKRLAIQP